MSTEELADRLIFAKRHVPFVQANLLEVANDDQALLDAWRDRLRSQGVWANDPVPLFPYPGSPDYYTRFGPPDEQAWERAHQSYLRGFRRVQRHPGGAAAAARGAGARLPMPVTPPPARAAPYPAGRRLRRRRVAVQPRAGGRPCGASDRGRARGGRAAADAGPTRGGRSDHRAEAAAARGRARLAGAAMRETCRRCARSWSRWRARRTSISSI